MGGGGPPGGPAGGGATLGSASAADDRRTPAGLTAAYLTCESDAKLAQLLHFLQARGAPRGAFPLLLAGHPCSPPACPCACVMSTQDGGRGVQVKRPVGMYFTCRKEYWNSDG